MQKITLKVLFKFNNIWFFNLEYWLNHANDQGLPLTDCEDGYFYYLYPRNGAVARLRADSDGADLGCSRYPADRDASLGVRAARKKI